MTAEFTFVHAADLHLGAPFTGVNADDPRVATALVDATYRAMERIVDLCVARGADFLVIAGDVTDQGSPRLKADLRFRDAMRALDDAGVRVFVARGNHDPADRALDRLELPPNVHFFSTSEVERVPFERDGQLVCALYGRSYARFDEKGNLARGFSRDMGDAFAIGVLHANVGGDSESEPYAPCNTADLAAAGMDYWALGHIHKPQTVCTTPLAVYPGSPQGLNPKETGAHGCVVVTVAAGVPRVEQVPLASVEWVQTEVDATGAAGVDDVMAAVRTAVDRARSEGEGRNVVVRLALTGRCSAHTQIAAAEDVQDLLEQARSDGMCGPSWVWVDGIRDRTAPDVDISELERSATFLGDVLRLTSEKAADAEVASALVNEVAAGVRSKVGRDAPIADDAADVLLRARDLLVDRLWVAEDES